MLDLNFALVRLWDNQSPDFMINFYLMAKNDKIGNDEKKTKSMLNNTLFHVKKF